MSMRLAKVNKQIQRILGEVIQRDTERPPEALITIARVETTANLRSTTVWLYVSPAQYAPLALEMLTHQLYHIQAALNNQLRIKPLPRIILRLDEGAQNAQRVEETLAEVKSSEEESTSRTQPDQPADS